MKHAPLPLLLALAPAIASARGGDTLEHDLCKARAGCKIARSLDVGRDAKGEPLRVVEVAVPDAQCRPDRRQYFRVNAKGEHEPVLDLCNDGYGAAGVGEDRVRVIRGRLVHEQFGGSSWRWDVERTFSLAPLGVVSEVVQASWTAGPNREATRWDHATLSGTTTWYAPTCDASGQPAVEKPGARQHVYHLSPIPRVVVNGAAPSWAKTALGNCALALDATGKGGFLVAGRPGRPADGWLRVVATGARELVIEIGDDHLVGALGDPGAEDRVELWLGPAHTYQEPCLDLKEAPRQWLIRAVDGKVTPGAGVPVGAKPPRVERWETVLAGDARRVRLRVVLPEDAEGITVAYNDTDDGLASERVLATSELRVTDAASLGREREVHPRTAVCTVDRPPPIEARGNPPGQLQLQLHLAERHGPLDIGND
jgi:hypothetical protein